MNELAQPFTSLDPLAGEASELATRMGRLLLQTGKVTTSQLNAIMKLQSQEGLHFEEAAAKLGLADEADIKAILARQFTYPIIDTNTTVLARCLTSAFRPQSAAAEALRSLRSELMLRYFNAGDPNGVALIGAEDPRGIAHATANLAISFAQTGARTLLIDGNLRQPQLHGWFGLDDGEAGLSDLLSGRVQVAPHAIEELGPLWVLPAGTEAPNPQELLSSRHYQDYLKPLHEAYEVVLISTAPMNKTRDAQIIVAQTGAALLITREHRTRMKDVENLCGQLRGLSVRLLGTALYQ